MRTYRSVPPGTAISRGWFEGILIRVNVDSPDSSAESTASDNERFEMNGNGCAGSNASGVSVGRIDSSNRTRSASRSASGSSSGVWIAIPSSASVGFSVVCQYSDWRRNSGCAASNTSSHCWLGVRPSGVVSVTPASICCLSPPTRFMKNSSVFFVKNARNRSRSSGGFRSSIPSWSTRSWKASSESSRLR